MGLPLFKNIKNKHNYEPVHIPLFEVSVYDYNNGEHVLTSNLYKFCEVDEDLLEVIICIDSQGESEPVDSIIKLFRERKIDCVLEGMDYNLSYNIILNQFNRKGEVIRRNNYNECVFICSNSERITFSYKTSTERFIE